MPDTGYNWDAAWTAVPEEDTTDWTAIDITDTNGAQSDPISNDGKAVTEVSILLLEDNTGACDATGVNIYLLGDINGTTYEDITYGSAWGFKVLAVQNQSVVARFRVLGSDYSSFRIHLQNESGQTLTTTMKFRQATIPVAS